MPQGDNANKAFRKHFEKYVERDIRSDITFSGDFELGLKELVLLLGLRYIKPPSSLLVLDFCSNHNANLPMYNVLLLPYVSSYPIKTYGRETRTIIFVIQQVC